MQRKILCFFLLVLILSVSGKMTLAQTPPLSLQQMVETSGFIFSGKVTKVWSERDAVTGFIVTYSTVTVQEAVRGISTNHFTFKQYGGSYNGLNVFVADMSYFTEGEEVFAFLYPLSAWGLTSPVGITEGKWAIRRDPATGKNLVLGNVLQAKMLESYIGQSTSLPTTSPKAAPMMEYDCFIKLLRAMVEHGR